MRCRNFSEIRVRDDRRRHAVTRATECARDELLHAHRRRATRVTLVTSRNGEARVKKKWLF